MEKIFSSLTPAVLITALLILGMLLGLLYWGGELFVCGRYENEFFCGFKKKSNYKEKEMFGYFNTLDDQKKTVCMSEKLKLKFYDDDNSIESSSKGQVHNKDGKRKDNKWIQKGFIHGNILSLAYITDDSPPTGSGVYYLVHNGSERVGYWLGLDFPTRKMVQCPYVLTQNEKPKDQTCEKKWPEIFKEKCTILHMSNS